MTTPTALRNRYARESVSTASPARLVTMLYDRLLRDLFTADAALERADLQVAHRELIHAQEIVQELRAGLDITSTWEGVAGLAALYDYLLTELLAANVNKDRSHIVNCQQVVEPLADAWHEAANAQPQVR
jgi:flagellar protein FliS